MRTIVRRFLPGHFSLRHMAVDAVLIVFSLYFSLWLRLGEIKIEQHLSALNHLAAGFLIIRLVTFLGFGVYQSLWRYISTHDATRLGAAVLASVPLSVSFN